MPRSSAGPMLVATGVASIVYIGKESNALEQVEQGLVHSLAEVQPRQPAPGRDAWGLVVRPAVARMDLAELTTRIGVTERHVRLVREGRRRPSQALEPELTKRAVRWAKKQLRTAKADQADVAVAQALLTWARECGAG